MRYLIHFFVGSPSLYPPLSEDTLYKTTGEWSVNSRQIDEPGPGELLVRIEATGLNPLDWKIRELGVFVQEWPAVLGFDGAGIVVGTGDDVQNFSCNDRVFFPGYVVNKAATFQQFCIVPIDLVAKVPENVSLEEAASLSVGVSTVVIGLYNNPPFGLGLTKPWQEGGRGKYSGKAMLVSGGSTSVGQYAIQFAKLSGFNPIVATASPSNFALLKSLGATHVTDRNSPNLAEDISKIAGSPIEYAFDGASTRESQQTSYDVLTPGGHLVVVLQPNFMVLEGKNIEIVRVTSTTRLSTNRSLGAELYAHMEQLLQNGEIKPNLIEVLPNGLFGIPEGLSRLQTNQVSGKKLIATPQATA